MLELVAWISAVVAIWAGIDCLLISRKLDKDIQDLKEMIKQEQQSLAFEEGHEAGDFDA